MGNPNLNSVANELRDLLKVKLSGAVANDARLYALRKQLAEVATASHAYRWESFGNLMQHSTNILDLIRLPLTEAEQLSFMEKMNLWIESCAAGVAKANRGRAKTMPVEAAGSVVSSGNVAKKI
jgi:hypothetical protein